MVDVNKLKIGDKLGKLNNYTYYKYPRYDFYTVDRISKNGNIVLSNGEVLYKNTINEEYEYREYWMYDFNKISSKVRGLDIYDIKELLFIMDLMDEANFLYAKINKMKGNIQ